MESTTLKIRGMHCANCGLLIDETLEDLPGVERSQTDGKKERAVVTFDAAATPITDIIKAIEDLGYEVELAGAG